MERPSDVEILTATQALPERQGWLLQAHDSLHDNECAWLHTIVLDGPGLRPRLPRRLAACPQVRILETEGHYGANAARNIALWQSTAEWVGNLDDDDIYPDRSLDRRLSRVEPEDDWVGGRLADIIDGVRQAPWDPPSPTGRLAAGELTSWWTPQHTTFGYHSSALLMRTSLVKALGGWCALPQDGDLMLTLAYTSLFPGLMLDEVVFCWRQHARQWTMTDAYLAGREHSRRITWERAQGLARLVSGDD